ncbi:hypothetical protein MBLNU230_g5073t1 [Neophaeotheca triangularis]
MADRLTQLQDATDELLTQFYATLAYIQTRHPYGIIPGQPSQAPASAPAQPALTNGDNTQNQTHSQQQPANEAEAPGTPPPEQPEVFASALRELAQDLILKEQQMEILINSLPGLGNSEAAQEARMRELEQELREVEKERAEAEVEKERMLAVLGEAIGQIKRIP